MSKCEPTQPRVRSAGNQTKLVSNSSSGALSRSNGRKMPSTVNSSHDARVGRPNERMSSKAVSRGSRTVAPCSSCIRGDPNRLPNVTVGSTLNSGAQRTRQGAGPWACALSVPTSRNAMVRNGPLTLVPAVESLRHERRQFEAAAFRRRGRPERRRLRDHGSRRPL